MPRPLPLKVSFSWQRRPAGEKWEGMEAGCTGMRDGMGERAGLREAVDEDGGAGGTLQGGTGKPERGWTVVGEKDGLGGGKVGEIEREGRGWVPMGQLSSLRKCRVA